MVRPKFRARVLDADPFDISANPNQKVTYRPVAESDGEDLEESPSGGWQYCYHAMRV